MRAKNKIADKRNVPLIGSLSTSFENDYIYYLICLFSLSNPYELNCFEFNILLINTYKLTTQNNLKI